MLDDKYLLELSIDGEIKELSFNFRFLKNLYSLLKQSGTNSSPIKFIDDFIKAEDKEGYYIDILYCMLNGEINLEDLQEIIGQVKESLFPVLYTLIVVEWRVEDIFENEENDNLESEEDENIDYEKEFVRFWDSNYYNAIYQLHMNEDEFLNCSPRKLGTLNRLHTEYYKNIILQRDIAMQKARNEVSEDNRDNEKVERCSRMRDIF